METSKLQETTEDQIKDKLNCYTADIIDLDMKMRGMGVELARLRILQGLLLQKLKEKILKRQKSR